MDFITQALVGAGLATAFARRFEIRIIAFAGALAGVFPSLDRLFLFAMDPLTRLVSRNLYLHSYAFIPIGAGITALVVFMVRRVMESRNGIQLAHRHNRMTTAGRIMVSRQFEAHFDTPIPPEGPPLTFSRLYLFSLVAWLAAGTLEALSTEGARLFWPINPDRISWNFVSGVDPVFTLFVFLGMAGSLFFRDKKPARWGLIAATLYIAVAALQHGRAVAVARVTAEERGQTIAAQTARATPYNIVLWRSVFRTPEGRIHVDAIQVPLIGRSRVYPGDSVAAFVPGRTFPGLPPDSRLFRNLERFVTYTRSFAAIVPSRPDRIGDLRTGALPNRLQPRIALQPVPAMDNPSSTLPPRVLRETGMDHRERLVFFRMLIGQELPAPVEDSAKRD